MNLLMGISLSFCMSLLGNLLSGAFTVPGFLMSFAISALISLCIGFIIPIGKIGANAALFFKLKPYSIPGRLLEAFISNLIYTPLMTLIMVALAHRNATSHGANIPFVPMYVHSLIPCLILGYVIVFLFTPVYLKIAMGKHYPGGQKK